MMDAIKKSMRGMTVYTIIMLVVGIIFAVNPGTSISVMTGFIAIIAMLLGGYFVFDYIRTPKENKLLSFSLAFGIVLIGIGLFIYLRRDALMNFITVLIGISLIVKAIYKLQIALNIRSITSKWKYNLLVALFTLTLGFILVLYPDGSAHVFLRIVGIVMTVGAIGELVETAYVMGSVKDANETPKEEAKELPFEEK